MTVHEASVRLTGIVKRFGTFTANDRIDVVVRPGTVHAIVGENGAGKSTLMKVLAGEERPDEGTVEVDGITHEFRSPRQAQQAGVGIVHQHFLLADALRVWENVVLADEPGTPWRLDSSAARERVSALAAENGFEVDVDAFVSDLGVGDRQRVEILKVLYREARVIILDEPTAVLVPTEATALFRSIRALTARGASVVFISHKLDEVLAFADEITVIRAGRVVGRTTPAETTPRELAGLMVEVAMPTVEPRTTPPGDDLVLAVADLTVGRPGERPLLDAVSLSVRSGEIVGVAGVEGNGQSELLAALLGRVEYDGAVSMGGRSIDALSTRERRALGLAYIPEDRHRDGVVLDFTLAENAALGYQQRAPIRRGWWFSRSAASSTASAVIRRFDVRGGGPGTRARALSGGNQQKFIIGRELGSDPTVLVAAHPTRGVDVGAQSAVWRELVTARDTGLGTLLVSADLDELLALSDRLLVMYGGRVVAELDPRTVTAIDLGEHMTGAHAPSPGDAPPSDRAPRGGAA
ncbi:ABC transporter ATP-binding protein [Frigoribacterium faeni]|uniref:Simple sugar transport system ATP-binding protein n=1 Tax=Frigoribacterium faeni TaxID=145483 RepID=A0A7W3PIW4_9MICO|nr:ABC transporter ATP-binding protein [Frigoribacterium faeni]MBA8813104.1 simple sugar transport system ATP-binding protein [Frigoribacterium faeni]GEK83408.1 sugar ABC transporter ATP-binding protein [Frigoribacterium faeni]